MQTSDTPIVLGIDPGIGRVGYGIIADDGDKPRIVCYGVIETERQQPVSDRLRVIHHALSDLIRRHKPNRIVVEKLFFAKNATTAMVVGEARGVVLLTASEAAIPVFEISPASVKKAITGYGRAEKGQVQRMLKAMFRLDRAPSPDDAADALALALHGSRKLMS